MGNSNVINDFFGPINKAKHQNAQRIQQQRENNFRNHVQNQNVPKNHLMIFLSHVYRNYDCLEGCSVVR